MEVGAKISTTRVSNPNLKTQITGRFPAPKTQVYEALKLGFRGYKNKHSLRVKVQKSHIFQSCLLHISQFLIHL